MSSELSTLLFAAQYADSAYPSGSFAHSWGLETAIADGHITDRDSLTELCFVVLQYQASRTDAVAAAACSRLHSGDIDGFEAVDRRLSSTRAAREARLASTRTGRRLLDTAVVEANPWLEALREAVVQGRTPGNYACAFGAVARLHDVGPAEVAMLSLWITANGLVAAALRLLPITHDDAQTILVRLRPDIARLAQEAAAADPAQMAGGAPQLEIWAMCHETAQVRLFAS